MLLLVSWAAPAAAGADDTQAAERTQARAVTLTFLKSQPGKLAQLERYVRLNWFAMDAIAVERGLFLDYRWLDTGADEGDWNAIVEVTYRDALGFDGIADAWAEIRRSHVEVRVEGASLKELGRVVETRTVYEQADPTPTGVEADALPR